MLRVVDLGPTAIVTTNDGVYGMARVVRPPGVACSEGRAGGDDSTYFNVELKYEW